MVGRPSSRSHYRVIPQTSDSLPLSESSCVGDQDNLDADIPPSPPTIDASIRFTHFVLGCAVLLPWNALITATPYFLSRLDGSPMRSSFSSYLSLTFTACGFGCLAHATMTSKEALPSRRALFGASTVAVWCSLLTFSTYLHPSPAIFFVFVLLASISMSAAGSYLQNAVIVIASLFGPAALQAVVSGQAAVGVVVSAIQCLSAAASIRRTPISSVLVRTGDKGSAEANAAFMFFGLSTLFMFGSAGAHVWMTRTPAYKTIAAPLEQPNKIARRSSSATESQGLVTNAPNIPTKESRDRIWRVAKSNAAFNFALAYVFIVTLAVFPPITVSILPTNPIIHPLLFTSFHFLVFNTGDLVGRAICSRPQLVIWSPTKILLLSLARTLFIPLFLLCNIQRFPPASPPLLPPSTTAFISSDSLYMLILLAFGISNGYLTSSGMIAAPSLEHNPKLEGRREDVDVAATLGSFSIVGGLAIGSLFSFAVKAAICQCDPFQ